MKKMLIFVFFILATQLSASTIIVNSVYDLDKNPQSLSASAAIEDGLMNTLFDFGFILFSAVNFSGYSIAGAEDARFMLSIEVLDDNFSVSYLLQATATGQILGSGIVDSKSINGDSRLEDRKIYYLLGEEVAAKLQQFF